MNVKSIDHVHQDVNLAAKSVPRSALQPQLALQLYNQLQPSHVVQTRKRVQKGCLMPTKKQLAAGDHAALGAALGEIYAELQRRSVQVGSAYPLTGPKGLPYRRIRAALKALSEARSELEEAYFREHPDVAEVTTYYPGQGKSEAVQ